MRWAFRALLSTKVIFWAAIIAGAVYFSPEIMDTFYGVVDRVDFAIGYPGSDQ